MRTLVTGGAASGKSGYAEALAALFAGPRFYIATLIPRDEESLARIERHHRMRAERGFCTLERYFDIEALRLPAQGTALLECLGTLTANEMFEKHEFREDVAQKILGGISNLEIQCEELVVVTNDVFGGGCAYAGETLQYMETLGMLNRALAARFERVVEVVCGIPVVLKGNPS